MAASNAYASAVEVAATLELPVTIVLGAEDKMTPARASGPLIEAFADVSVIRLEGVGHFMATENPVAVRKAIAQGIGWDGTR